MTTAPEIAQNHVQNRAVSLASNRNPVQPGDVPGSEQIVSVTERVGEPTANADQSPQVAADSSGATSPSLEAKGWTARRPTYEVRR
jgi:hypothetical protein